MKENFYIGLVPEIASFVTGLDEVERLIGKGFVFHDAEIELELPFVRLAGLELLQRHLVVLHDRLPVDAQFMGDLYAV